MGQIRKGKQLLAVALSALLAVGSLPTMAFANGGGQNPGEHTVDCGYAQGQPCEHKVNGGDADKEGPLGGKHSKTCYTDDLICGYIVDEDNIASDSDATASDSNAEHTHTQECYALDCPHEREEHKVNGVPAKTIAAWTFIDDDNYLTEGVLALPGVNAGRQADFDTVVSMLPTQIRAEVEGETDPIPVDITGWSCLEFAKGPDGNWPLTGEYTFTANLQKGYACEPMPTVKVLVGGAELYGTEAIVGDFTVTGASAQYDWNAPVLTIKSGATVTIQNTNPNAPTTHRIKVAENATNVNITLAGVNIDLSDVSTIGQACAFDMTGASVNLTLAGGSYNFLISNSIYAGLQVPDGAALIVDGAGELDAVCEVNGAGIGSDQNQSGGNITIQGSVQVRARGGNGAGIGSGNVSGGGKNGGNITIKGNAEVTATSDWGAGIGGGFGGNSGAITIQNSARVTATSNSGAGIGGGLGGNGGAITIQNSAQVTATSNSGAGIGGGEFFDGTVGRGGKGGDVVISGENTRVVARSEAGNDIGSGSECNVGGTLSVTGGATLEMQNSGTNVNTPEYKECTVIDSQEATVEYDKEGKAIPALSLEADPVGSQERPGDITLTATLSGAAPGNGEKTITFTVNDTNHSGTTDADGKATYTVGSPSVGIYTFGASFEGDNKNNTATAISIRDYVVAHADQTGFAISDPGAKTYGDGGFTLGTTGGQSTGGVRFSTPSGNGILTVTENGEVSIIGAGKVTVTATKAGDSDYNQATALRDITVAPRDIANVTVNVTGSRIYTGSQLQPIFEVRDGNIAITTGDYTNSYGSNVDVGMGAGSITLIGQRNYTGTKEVSFDIEKRSLTGAAITLESGPYRYTGTEVKPAVTGVMLEGIVIPAGAFDVGYTDNTGTGTATVTITAKADSNFSGSASTTFEITRSRSSDSDSSDDGSYTNPNILQGSWVQTEAGVWMFRQTSGSYAMNRWGMVDGLWYFFDAEGKMLTGWQFLGGQWYYLCTKEDLAAKAGMKEGAMASGWHFDPLYQKWFYLDTNGAMVSGWLEIDGKWHYFNPASDGTRGTMVTDSVIDGRYIDKNGVWNGN